MNSIHLLALCSILFAGAHAAAESLANCQSTVIYQPYTSCESPQHGKNFRELRTKACGPEKYNWCNIVRPLDVRDYTFDWHVNEQNPRSSNAGPYCATALATNPQIKNKLAEIASLQEYWDYWKEKSTNPSEEAALLNHIASLDPSKFDVYDNERSHFNGLYEGQANWHNIKCIVSVRITASQYVNSEKCGVKDFKLCRDPSHGYEEKFINKVSPACAIDPKEVKISSVENLKALGSDANKRGKLTCPTIDDADESKQSSIDNKINELNQNLHLVKNILQKGVGEKKTIDSLTRVQLQILLELYRLAVKSGRVEVAANDKVQISELVNSSNLESTIDFFAQTRRLKALQSLAKIFPEDFQSMADKNVAHFTQLSDLKYISLFPSGILLQKSDLIRLSNEVQHLTGAQAFRATETIVRSTLAEAKDLDIKALKLLELRESLPRDAQDLEQLVISIMQVRGLGAADAQELREQWQALLKDRQRLNSSITNFLDSQINSLEREAKKKIEDLWKFVDRMASNDPRQPLLQGYHALVQADASGFKRSLEESISHLKDNTSYEEAVYSINLLQSSARKTLSALRDLQKILHSSTSAQKSFIALITHVVEKRDVNDDKLVQLVMDALEGLNGEAGANIAFRANLKNVIADTYERFMTSLDNLPSIPN